VRWKIFTVDCKCLTAVLRRILDFKWEEKQECEENYVMRNVSILTLHHYYYYYGNKSRVLGGEGCGVVCGVRCSIHSLSLNACREICAWEM
jgi:hypothetical protein